MPEQTQHEPELVRGVGTIGATTLNMIDMIGVGPFITMPLIIAAMGGPQAMFGWILGALLVMCDGLVWAELGASMPKSGGPYNYLKEIYGPNRLGRLMSFLFIWQLTFSAPLSIASGSLGLAQYGSYIFPSMGSVTKVTGPILGAVEINSWPIIFAAIGALCLAVFLLYRRITLIERFSKFLWVGVVITILWVIFAGLTHFDSNLAFDFPSEAFELNGAFFQGLGAALLIAVYDYWGYYNVNFFAGEIKEPEKTIPRAIIFSIIIVAVIYIVMNISILGVIPWQDFIDISKNEGLRQHMISSLMERLYGTTAGTIATLLIIWTAFASVFSLLLGYSRVPYAAALDGNYFKIFSKVHPTKRFPYLSLLVMGAFAGLFCFFKLADIIAAMVVIRILIQFLAQIVGLLILRKTRPEMPRPFKMWLYPLPALIAIAGFLFVLFSRPNFQKEIKYAAVLIVLGLIIYFVRAYFRKEFPFSSGEAVTA
ncbi:MAG TPA: APC family permease [Pyrinomonadaceae bacterium]|nr:APC family permease [Pyrinomonadaceae bacterium]